MVISKQRVGQANSVGPIAHFGETKMLRREIENSQPHLDEIEIPIGETDLLGFVAVAMTSETQWRRIDRIGGAEFDFWFRSYVDVEGS